jgi:TolB protein
MSPIATGLATASAPAWAPDGATIAFEGSGPSGSLIYTVAPAGGVAKALTSGKARDSSPAWAPDGSLVYFASDRSGAFEVWSVKSDGTGLTKVTTGAKVLGGPAVSPDGTWLAFAQPGAAQGSGASTVIARFTLATKASSVISALNDSEPAFATAAAARGRMAVTSTRYGASNQEVVLMNDDGGAPFRLTDQPGVDGHAAFQP